MTDLTVVNNAGRRFHAVITDDVERYPWYTLMGTHGPVVRIYDATYEGDRRFPDPEGQFVCDYYAATLLDPTAGAGGLDLKGDVPAWRLSAANVAAIRDALITFDRNHRKEPSVSDWTVLLEGLVKHHSPAGDGMAFSSYTMLMSGDPDANAIVDAAAAAYRDAHPMIGREQIEALVGQKVSILTATPSMMGAGSIQALAGTIFEDLAVLPKGKRKNGYSMGRMLAEGRILDVVPGYAGVDELAERVAAVRATLPQVRPLTAGRIAELPARSNTCSLAVFGSYHLEDKCPGTIWLCNEYDSEDDIVSNVLILRPEGGTSEHGSCYGRDLLSLRVGEVVGFEPMTVAEALDLTDAPYAEAVARLSAASVPAP